MAEGVEAEHEWSDWALDTAGNSVMAVETLLATLRAFEDVLRQQEISVASSTEYCDNFCQALMHYAGSRNSMEHGLPLLEVYCLSINCFAAARSHLTADSDRVTLVLKRLALSCFELLLSVPENEIPFEAWLQFHQSVQITHDTLLQYGSTDLQALLQITGEGGAWINPVLTALLTGQSTNPEEVDAYISLEGEGFMEMRVKHLEKMGEVAKAVVLAKACTECSFIPNQATFRQTYVSLLCHLLPNEEAIMEISRLDCKDVLDITSNLETEGEENTAFILCTTYLTQQLQQQSLYCSWELMLLWSKLQKKLDPSLMSLLERCLQLGAIAKTVQHLLYLVRVIQTEAENQGVPASVELCVKALQLPKQEDSETRTSVCKTVSCLLPSDLEVLRACQLTEFLIGSSQEAFTCLEELYLRPDQKYDQENEVIPNSLRCELLLALKAYWPFDPEFWDWKTLKYHCISLLGLRPESEEEDEEEVDKQEKIDQQELQGAAVKVEPEHQNRVNGGLDIDDHQDNKPFSYYIKKGNGLQRPKFWCQICKRSITDIQIIHHSKIHIKEDSHPCPVCLEKFKDREDLVLHMRKHIRNEIRLSKNVIKKKNVPKQTEEEDDIEPGEIPVDPSLMLYYKCTHDPEVLQHIVQQTKTLKEKHADDDEHVTFDYMDRHFKLQNREEYPCPGTNCTRTFKHSKYLYVHLKSDHIGDENVKYFHQVRDKRQKCVFCRRHFISAYHHRKHRKVHYGDRPYICVVIGCGAQFKTTNGLVTHKQTHGYQLNYQCELNGCYVTYADLGQIYHHEAQHFRDAAFTCCSKGCKKFYLSKKDFIKHLSTHKITFTEDDFEAQRKAKRKLFKPVVREVTPNHNGTVNSIGVANGGVLNSQSVSCVASSQESDVKEAKATITLVAMCFDGSKFTCGFEKCGMTFSRARDVQRHLKCAHPDHLKLENREHKHDKEQELVSKGIKTETEPEVEEKGKNETSTSVLPVEPGKDNKVSAHSKGKEPNLLGLNTKCDALKELIIGLSNLSLDTSPSHSLPIEHPQPTPVSKTSQMSLHQAIMAKPPVVLLKKRPHLSEGKIKVQTETTLLKKRPQLSEEKVKVQTEPTLLKKRLQPSEGKVKVKIEPFETADKKAIELLASARPYICKNKGCGFKSGQSYSLQRHYNTVHSYRLEEAKRLIPSFQPYKCHLCPKSVREKRVLKVHYLNTHKLSEHLLSKISNAYTQYEGSETPTCSTKQTSQPFNRHGPKVKCESPKQEHLNEANNSSVVGKNGQNIDSHSPFGEEGEDNEQKGQNKDEMTQKLRNRRLMAKSNMCYILDKFSKPFHCVAKNCDAAFNTQGGLVRHLQLVHHYNRSQLLLENDGKVQQSPDVRKDPAKKRLPPNSDEPQPQFKCHFANCNASYHLKSSLVRHTRDYHSQPPGLIKCKFDGCSKVFSHNDALKKHTLYSHCEYYDSLVVRLQSSHKKSVTGCQKKLIVMPQRPQKEETSSPTPQERSSGQDVAAQSEEKGDIDLEGDSNDSFSRFVLRSHEEALQMCQDRCMPVAHPCMVQNCDSVVIYMRSLQRHYLTVHRMRHEDVVKNGFKLFFNAEQLEELIQRKSARPPVTEVSSNQVFKTECEAELENTGGVSSPKSHNSVKTETQGEAIHDLHSALETEENSHRSQTVSDKKLDSHDRQKVSEKEEDSHDLQRVSEKEEKNHDSQKNSEKKEKRYPRKVSDKKEDSHNLQKFFENEKKSCNPQKVSETEGKFSNPQKVPPKEEELLPTERNDTLVADEVLPGEASTAGPTEVSAAALQRTPKQEQKSNLEKFIPLLRPVTVDLSPPYSLRLVSEESFQNAPSNKDNSKILNGSALVTSPPVRQPLKRKNELSEQPLNVKETRPNSPPCLFDIAAYKPMGFEASFLKFIQETTTPVEKEAPVKRRDRRSCSVKENNQLGISHTRSRRTHSPLVKSRAVTGSFTSVQNLKSILDKALAGCGDLAIKQLQYLRPVVVLGRPVCTATLSDLFPSETNNSKQLLGS
ncbi:zinc finger protein Rlf [Nematolebias whitei]|uniref:zinc finger protein Rlf n=1 Tax=Nematolebias whitei TaxID=451745 RepID=UPI0018989526|nr:zinc finger protein Rlf [Nematolebias whitei]